MPSSNTVNYFTVAFIALFIGLIIGLYSNRGPHVHGPQVEIRVVPATPFGSPGRDGASIGSIAGQGSGVGIYPIVPEIVVDIDTLASVSIKPIQPVPEDGCIPYMGYGNRTQDGHWLSFNRTGGSIGINQSVCADLYGDKTSRPIYFEEWGTPDYWGQSSENSTEFAGFYCLSSQVCYMS